MSGSLFYLAGSCLLYFIIMMTRQSVVEQEEAGLGGAKWIDVVYSSFKEKSSVDPLNSAVSQRN